MRVQALLAYGAGILGLLHSVIATPLVTTEPEVIATAAFPEENAFGHVTNGERNNIFISVENKSNRNITLQSVAGSFHHPDTSVLIKNTTALTYKIPLLEGGKIQIPYSFYSEHKPGDWRLNIWVDHTVDDEQYRVIAYDSIVKVVEPPMSFFDIKLWITYLIVAGFLGGAGYFAYLSLVPQPKKRKAPTVSAPVTVTATTSTGYSEEWIPEHHLKKPKQRKATGAATSGDETSGAELSSTEGRKRKGKK